MLVIWSSYAAALVVSLATLLVCGQRLTADTRRSANRRRLLSLALSALAVLLVLASPLDWLSDQLFSAHMVEHELLLNTIPLALLTSGPVALTLTVFRSLPAKWRRAFGKEAIRCSRLRRIGARLGFPVPALLLSGLALWAWHAPAAYDYALRYGWAHALEHASFLVTALLYWGPLLRRSQHGSALNSNTTRALYLMAGAMQSGVLGALIALSGNVIYTGYLQSPQTSREAVLVDQRLGGSIMWFAGPAFCGAISAAIMR